MSQLQNGHFPVKLFLCKLRQKIEEHAPLDNFFEAIASLPYQFFPSSSWTLAFF